MKKAAVHSAVFYWARKFSGKISVQLQAPAAIAKGGDPTRKETAPSRAGQGSVWCKTPSPWRENRTERRETIDLA
ncbi:hypothetical protein [Bacillus marinisedimentorum]|uniref:hypothetical protein n=1 Tax=Bacillus marinisedimentorum TaxID=1821260 RepID=UPI000871FF54|nr:hypothetical protein [Bacillus marinisedimentorum]